MDFSKKAPEYASIDDDTNSILFNESFYTALSESFSDFGPRLQDVPVPQHPDLDDIRSDLSNSDSINPQNVISLDVSPNLTNPEAEIAFINAFALPYNHAALASQMMHHHTIIVSNKSESKAAAPCPTPQQTPPNDETDDPSKKDQSPTSVAHIGGKTVPSIPVWLNDQPYVGYIDLNARVTAIPEKMVPPSAPTVVTYSPEALYNLVGERRPALRYVRVTIATQPSKVVMVCPVLPIDHLYLGADWRVYSYAHERLAKPQLCSPTPQHG
ncbi:hypothetical protein H4R35_001939 [Dimargaris xerosporica]|nr:hypothetical protein H4R35_001939 [Dimargaris xerosporica]